MASLVASQVLALRPKGQRGSVGRPTRLTVQNNVKLVHVKQNTQQKIASMQVGGRGRVRACACAVALGSDPSPFIVRF
jgi:hypothetical protein